MSAKRSKVNRTTFIFATVLPAALLAVLGVTAYIIINITSTVEAAAPLSNNGVPETWHTLPQKTLTESETSARIVNNSYVEYTTSLKNNSSTETIAITHLSSYLNGNDQNGFIPLSDNSLQYTYTPENPSSWTPVSIAAPSGSDDGFKLDYNLYAGRAETNTDTIYFRYNVNLADDDGLVDDIVSFVSEDSSSTGITSSSATIDYAIELIPENVSWAEGATTTDAGATSDESGEYAKPLGVFSETPTSTIINISRLGAVSISTDTLVPSIIIICVAIALFAIGLTIYLIHHKKSRAKKSHSRKRH